MDVLDNEQLRAEELTDWRKLAQRLHARYRAPDARAAGRAAADFLALDGAGDRLEVRLFGAVLDLALCDRTEGRRVTRREVELARAVSRLAGDHELVAQPAEVTQLELALDTANRSALAPFWAALLTGDGDGTVRDEVFDPTDRVPSLWFQNTDDHDPPRQRWHLDLWLAPESAEARIAAAVAAGGTVVDDDNAPSFTVLADPDGNRVCVCTSLAREDG
ncbi:VOC family protein [Microlunatus parietis]|uniref:4a-hydroxytetrahydrobiopterin dehydratase n=1 Tax=Microlunatus parietis TaxID=682979 RepID=A0A7Y9IAG7_9ACTN|nr:VOC family protein [Microlunatus parietis]NYE73316.1 4a-hydroxytetrahydrobiopterin dehydratase [Microlunatus parietis]